MGASGSKGEAEGVESAPATQPLRELLMPQAAKAVPLEDLADALDYHTSITGQ